MAFHKINFNEKNCIIKFHWQKRKDIYYRLNLKKEISNRRLEKINELEKIIESKKENTIPNYLIEKIKKIEKNSKTAKNAISENDIKLKEIKELKKKLIEMKRKVYIKKLNEKYNEFLEVVKADIKENERKNKELDDYFLLLHDDLRKMKSELEKDSKYRNYFDKYEVLNNFIHN